MTSCGLMGRSFFGLMPVDVVGAGQPARGEQHHEKQRGRRERDHDRGQHQSLRQRVGKARRVRRHALLDGLRDDRRKPLAHPAHHEDKEVDGVGKQRQSDDDLEGARPQEQPDPGPREHGDAKGDDDLHQRFSAGGRCARVDWWASAISNSPVAPTTRAKTPRSKKNALGRCRLPENGSSMWATCEVRNG